MGNLIVNNVTKGYGQIYARVLYFIHNYHDVFDNNFQLHRLNAPNSFSNIKGIQCKGNINADERQVWAIISKIFAHIGSDIALNVYFYAKFKTWIANDIAVNTLKTSWRTARQAVEGIATDGLHYAKRYIKSLQLSTIRNKRSVEPLITHTIGFDFRLKSNNLLYDQLLKHDFSATELKYRLVNVVMWCLD